MTNRMAISQQFLSPAEFSQLYKNIGSFLNSACEKYNFRVADTAPAGKPASIGREIREYRLQLINKSQDTSEAIRTHLPKILEKEDSISDVKYNELSPNSSKYPSVSFTYKVSIYSLKVDVVIAKGANKGENFEKKVVTDLQSAFKNAGVPDEYKNLIKKMSESNEDFKKNEIKRVYQRSGSTKKEGVAIEKLNEVIGDIVLEDSGNKKWYISLKDVNGDTFSSYSGAASLMKQDGTLDPKSEGADFLKAFGADLNKVQEGYDIRNPSSKKTLSRKAIPTTKPDVSEMKSIFERAWGMNYFYVRRMGTNSWKVFWLDRRLLTKLVSNLKVTDIRYPSKTSKQITIYCGNNIAEYIIEVRNSKGGEYPNDIKIKAKRLLIA